MTLTSVGGAYFFFEFFIVAFFLSFFFFFFFVDYCDSSGNNVETKSVPGWS